MFWKSWPVSVAAVILSKFHSLSFYFLFCAMVVDCEVQKNDVCEVETGEKEGSTITKAWKCKWVKEQKEARESCVRLLCGFKTSLTS